ncbi:hypothetical protein [Helicobacter mesocricetorum]|uniref:hypothetical protein n=1 Tax=Helicobacter mesocricetorum TaxID=87012 RepID=UPI000CF09778|nr:hypothetical protein [Helicobacter mesocricetorum]
MKAFLAQIDWIRNTFFFVFYFFLVVIIFLSLVNPQLQEFKKENTNYRKELHITQQVQKQKMQTAEALAKYQADNNTLLNAFKANITQETIKEKLSSIFQKVDVVKNGNSYFKNGYLAQNYIVSGRVADIQAINDVLIQVMNLQGIVYLAFPIHIEAEEGVLVFSFSLEVYSLP